ncbi:CinA family nicotinamide mononucleotide deamidase-related protein [Nonlabens tegetincola]|uniref:CinA family nicotinamide mononucleotide deamidase-related protein n=1 Tax=Nonlabens tegetincola TaxID=323273 RepID=UPI0030C85D5C
MLATLITVGDEILIGQIVDTNSAWMAQELNKIGVQVNEIITTSDDKDSMISAFAKAESQSDIVLITGGLGPTKDDVTKLTLAEYFDDTLVKNEEVLEHVKYLFEHYVKKPMEALNENQALVPSKAKLLKNSYGTAPGMWLERNNTIFISMPGVPFEMKHLMSEHVLPEIKKIGNLPFIYHRTIITAGVGESTIATKIADWENALPIDIKLAYLPSLGTVRLRLSCIGAQEEEVKQRVDSQVERLYELIGDIVVGEGNDDSLAVQVTELFKKSGKSLSTAESCTGGKIANLLTEIPGASQIFKGSTVTYATQSKVDVLGVDASIIEKHSVVSAPVAQAMAAAAQKIFKSDYAIATTGNAGPSKGDSDAQVGTVFIGIATPTNTYAMEFFMGNHRERVVQKSVNKAFEMLQQEILKSL